MKTSFILTSILAGLFLLRFAASAAAYEVQSADIAHERQAAHKAFAQGNFRDAYDALRKLLVDKSIVPEDNDLNQAVLALEQLNRVSELDDLLEAAVKSHEGDPARWSFLWAAARQYQQIPHQGFIIGGRFARGPHRGGDGRPVITLDRDRARALQLMVQVLPAAREDNDHAKVADYLLAMADVWLRGREGRIESWRLQAKTDLATLPDYEEGWGYNWGGQTQGAPVDEQGNPVYFTVPKTFETAQSDGQRWRWSLEQAVEFNPALKNRARIVLADFLREQFDVATLAAAGWQFGREQTDDSLEEQQSIFALSTLTDDETIARLASGIRRFKLPGEFNFIAIYKQVADDGKSDSGKAALVNLASVFENRRQYPKAADVWRRLIRDYPAAGELSDWKKQLDQIEGNWGRFEPVMSQPAGQGATIEYRFRNGIAVELEAHEIKLQKLLDDVKAYIKSRPQQPDWQQINVGDLGYRLVTENQQQYIGEKVAAWRMEIKPRPEHFDRRVTIATPLQNAGAYLLKARMVGGNTSYIIVWLKDTTIVKKPLDQQAWYYVADAVSGAPIAKANVEFFGWQQRWHDNRSEMLIKNSSEFTDAQGQLVIDARTQPADYQWLIIATTPPDKVGSRGRLAYLGFSSLWYPQRYDATYNETKVYMISDRPVYRPEQPVHYKFWIGQARYDLPDAASPLAGREFAVEIQNPKGEKVFSETKQADNYGGLDGQWKLPADAALGVYNVIVKAKGSGAALLNNGQPLGGGMFRVEEYKKPEFEVTVDAPAEPVALGEKVTATIRARYYFGSPVTKAKVKYKIERTVANETWYPPNPWDWLYGSGYWWFASDYDWYPGWRTWGIARPMSPWWPRPQLPPELVAERQVDIGADGTVKVEIDTAVAKAIHGDEDHKYTITAEVADASRRTIVGAGSVLATIDPFDVYVWLDRGYFRVGDTIHAGLAARRPDGKPVAGHGDLTLLKITYDKKMRPVETPVQSWKVDPNADGQAQQQIDASQAGQYRLSYKVTDAKNHAIEGGYIFTVIGQGFDGAQFRFNHLELVPDKGAYAAGDKLKLQINTDRAGSTVLLFVRPTDGIYLKPKLLQLAGKSTVEEIEVATRDMPNFFVEAVTVADGRVYTETREIAVPPQNRVLNVEVKPLAEGKSGYKASAEFQPSQKAKVAIKLTDSAGKPFVGSTVVAIYDKSVEYISGGSNVPEIKEFFWKWRRNHSPSTESNLGGYFANFIPPNSLGMIDVGVFGGDVAEDTNIVMDTGVVPALTPPRGPGSGGDMDDKPAAAAMAAPAPADAYAMKALDSAAPAEPAAPPPATAQLVQPTIRTKFADTALWIGQLTTESNGAAEVELKMPENLTAWRIKVWGMGFGSRVGQGQTDVVTRKDLIIRLEAPRFFVQTDEVVLSAVVHNYLKTAKKVEVSLDLEGKTLEVIREGTKLSPKPGHPVRLNEGSWYNPPLDVPAGGEARVDWRVKVLDEGEATVRMKALTDEESDAMEQKFPCYVHGMLKMESRSGVVRGSQTDGTMNFTVPEKRRPGQSRLEVHYSPTLAGAMVDALPYLVDYPYGCTEQTLNRFLPTVITQKILLDMKLNLAEIRKKRTNLNAQEIGNDTERARQWQRYARNPVFDEDEVRCMVKNGVNRLTEMQLSDGGWGWFSGFGEQAWPHTTALVVHGLETARHNDVALVPGVLERGVEWLRRYQDEQVVLLKNASIEKKPADLRWKSRADEQDAFDYMVLVEAGVKNPAMRDFLYRNRTKIAVYGLAMFGIALQEEAEKEKLAMVLQNINQYVQQDNENQTAWLNLPEGSWWYWYGSEYEAEAYYLKLLSRTDPKGELASRFVKYLLNNRKNATYWNSTRDTALVIEALGEYLKASGESRPEMTVEVWYDGKQQKSVEITPQTVFSFDNRFVLTGDAVAAREHQVTLKKKGAGPLYYNGYLTTFTLEDFIAKTGLEIKVQRKYYKLVKADQSIAAAGSRGQVVEQKVEKYERRELENLATVRSGDLVEIELEIESKNDYEYLIFEDMKPASFEPVEQQSGYTGNDLGAYVEYRDNRVVFFARTLARGRHSVSYRMRAETPGQFSALPTRAWAMYAPELKGNSDEIKLKVKD